MSSNLSETCTWLGEGPQLKCCTKPMGAAAIEVPSKGTIDGIGQVENKDIQTLTRIINFL